MCPTLEGYVEKVPKKLNLIFTRLKVIFGGENKWKHWLVPPFTWNMRIENLNMNILISWWTILLFHFMMLYNCTRQVFNSNAMNVPNVRVENHNTKRWMGWYGRCFLFFFCECLHLCSCAKLFGEDVLCLELEDFENHPYMEFCRCRVLFLPSHGYYAWSVRIENHDWAPPSDPPYPLNKEITIKTSAAQWSDQIRILNRSTSVLPAQKVAMKWQLFHPKTLKILFPCYDDVLPFQATPSQEIDLVCQIKNLSTSLIYNSSSRWGTGISLRRWIFNISARAKHT